MQTIYYETSSFIRHKGNVVDLASYRQKLSAVSGGDWDAAPLAEAEEDAFGPAPVAELYIVADAPHCAAPRRTRRPVSRLSVYLDLCASAAVVLFALCAMARFVAFS